MGKSIQENAVTLHLQLVHKAYGKQWFSLKACVKAACKAAFAHEHVSGVELSLVLADDAAVKALNRDFRGKDKPTNVLAFPSCAAADSGRMTADKKKTVSRKPSSVSGGEAAYLGDIIISLDTVAREAKEQGKPFEHHLAHLVVHACLHLLGHDHMKKAEAVRMEAKEIAILKGLGIANPYED